MGSTVSPYSPCCFQELFPILNPTPSKMFRFLQKYF
jgi:hypothetical protein